MEQTILELIEKQLNTYPALQLQDCIKLLYQRFMGSEHMAMPQNKCYEMLIAEKEKIGTDTSFPAYEEIGENCCRFHLLPLSSDACTMETLTKLFLKSVNTLSGNSCENKIVFEEVLAMLSKMIQSGLLPYDYKESCEFLTQYRQKGCPAIHHSDTYRTMYRPAYRLLRTDFAYYFPLITSIDRLLKTKSHVVIAIDGKCGGGKSTLATLLSELYSCNLIHMDDFYLPKELRTANRLSTAGGNIHYERFSLEVLPALKELQCKEGTPSSTPFIPSSYRVFDCHLMDYKKELSTINDKPLTIVEGSYSLRPEFREAYDLKIFLDIPADVQKIRLLARNGEEAYKNFESKWIPMELKYFNEYQIANCCDMIFTAK